MTEALISAGLVAIMVWAHLKNACPDCGDQLLWVNPKLSKEMPLTRCFRCEGAHPAYVKEEYHHQFDFGEVDDGP